MTEYSLYLHIPFCSQKCGYCHFYVRRFDSELKERYLKALHREIALRLPTLKEGRLRSIYFGGGTPSLLLPSEIDALLQAISPPSAIEITLEANPESVTRERMSAYRSSGVNRISLGVQSLDDSLLELLTRRHSSELAERAVLLTKEAGFDNISIDLMYEIPKESPMRFEASLKRALKLPITHLSLYNLTFEPHTPFYRRQESLLAHLPSDEESKRTLESAIALLQAEGFSRYEISAFAKETCESVHNSGYWTARPFLGLGPSAHSFIGDLRFANVANLLHYEEALEQGELPPQTTDPLSPAERTLELLAIRLRLFKPFAIKEYLIDDRTLAKLEHFQALGWLTLSQGLLSLTEEGALFYDTIAEEIIDDASL